MKIGYKNISLQALKKLMKESKIILVIALGVANFVLDLTTGVVVANHVSGFLYLVCLLSLLMLDAVVVKSRLMVAFVGIYVGGVTLYFIFQTTVGFYYVDIVYETGENRFYKRAIKRAIFVDIFTLIMMGLITFYRDTEFEMYLFVRANIFRETGETTNKRRDVGYLETRVKEKLGRGSLVRGVSQLEEVVANEKDMTQLRRIYSSASIVEPLELPSHKKETPDKKDETTRI